MAVRGAAEGEPSQKNPKMTDREMRNQEGSDGVQAVLAEMAAVIERAAADLSLAEEPSRFAAALEHGVDGGARDAE